nr:hypothetical protein [uncultured Allomuricauda sp.]
MSKLLTYIDNCLGLVFDRVSYSCHIETNGLAIFRIFYGISLLLYFIPSWRWIGKMPQGFFQPPILSIAGISNGFPPPYFFSCLDLLIIIFVVFITIGFYTRWSFLMAFLISCIGFSYAFSFGKIDHTKTLFIFSLLVLGFTNIGTQYALRKDKPLPDRYQKWALNTLGIIIVFGFFTAGLAKLVRWIDFDLTTNGFLSWFFPKYYMYNRQELFANLVFSIPYPVFEIADYTVAILEVFAFTFLLLGRRMWMVFLILLCLFHLGNMLILNIEFTYNFLVYGIFLISPFFNYKIVNISHLKKWHKLLIIGTVIILVFWQLIRQYFMYFIPHSMQYYTDRILVYYYVSIAMWGLTFIIGYFSLGLISKSRDI